jgi:hypothetical protein
MNKDLIIATAIGYQFHHIELFLVSLHEKFNGTLLLLTDKEYKLDTYSYKVIIGNIHTEYYQSALPCKLNSPHNRRLFYSNKFVVDHPEYERIMMADIRDVVFQEDPFLVIVNDKVQVAMEDVRIGENEFNTGWVKALKGDAYLEKVKNEFVSCCGTIAGERKGMLYYLTYITNMIAEKGSVLDTGANIFFIDQGSHNIFCIEHPQLIHKHTNAIGKIFTMSYPAQIILSRVGTFINEEGTLYSLVHQYDRYTFLNDMLRNRYKIFYFQDLKNAIKSFKQKYL